MDFNADNNDIDYDIVQICNNITEEDKIFEDLKRLVSMKDLNKGFFEESNYDEIKNIKDIFINHYIDKIQSPYKAAELGYIDEIIKPQEIKIKIIQSLKILSNKYDSMPKKKHGNIPL